MASNRTLQSNRPDHCLQTRSLRCGLSSGARLRVSPAALRQRDQDGRCLLRVYSVEKRLSLATVAGAQRPRPRHRMLVRFDFGLSARFDR
jgi:hypothetical protein